MIIFEERMEVTNAAVSNVIRRVDNKGCLVDEGQSWGGRLVTRTGIADLDGTKIAWSEENKGGKWTPID